MSLTNPRASAVALPRAFFAPEGGSRDVDIHTQANEIMSLLGDEGGADTAADAGAGNGDADAGQKSHDAGDGTEAEAGNAEAQADADAADTADEGEAQQPADKKAQDAAPIEPPVSWKAEDKEFFKTLPRKAQQKIADREREREATLTRTQQESAETRRAAETQIRAREEAWQKERNDHVTRVTTAYKVARSTNPVIARGDALDLAGWDALLAQDPAARTKYEMQVNTLNQQFEGSFRAIADQDAASKAKAETARNEAMQTAWNALSADPELGPIWKDDRQRQQLKSQVKDYLKTKGAPAEAFDNVADSWVIAVARDAMLYRQMLAQTASIQERKKLPTPQRTVRPQASGDDRDSGDGRSKAQLKRFDSATSLHDKADALAALL